MNRVPLIFVVFLLSICCAFGQLADESRDSITEVVKNNTEVAAEKVKLNWMSSYEDALKKAKKESKPVLIYFTGSDWCAPCITLDKQFFYTHRFKDLSDKELVLLEVDFPKNQNLLPQDKISENLYLKERYKVSSFPTLLFVNHRGRKVAEKNGYILPEYYYPFIESVVLKK